MMTIHLLFIWCSFNSHFIHRISVCFGKFKTENKLKKTFKVYNFFASKQINDWVNKMSSANMFEMCLLTKFSVFMDLKNNPNQFQMFLFHMAAVILLFCRQFLIKKCNTKGSQIHLNALLRNCSIISTNMRNMIAFIDISIETSDMQRQTKLNLS